MPAYGNILPNLLQIILINVILSGDNAVVIGMAAHTLPPKQRRFAIIFGGGAAIVLRIVLTTVAALLLAVPAVRAVGGVLLLWIAFKLLEQEEEKAQGERTDMTLGSAILTILVADLIMSLDNVLGVAAASGGNLGLLIFGLLVSMAIVMVGGGLFAELIDRVWWLAYAGAAVIAWTGTDIALSDQNVKPFVEQLPDLAPLLLTAVVTVVVVAAAHFVHRHPRSATPGRPAPESVPASRGH